MSYFTHQRESIIPVSVQSWSLGSDVNGLHLSPATRSLLVRDLWLLLKSDDATGFSSGYHKQLKMSANMFVWPVPIQVSKVERRWFGPIRAVPQIARCPSGSILFPFVLQSTIFCHWFVYTVILLLIYSVHSTSIKRPGGRDPSFFLIRVKGLRTEGVVSCTDCKTPWGKLWFVITGYINKTDLTWLTLILLSRSFS